MKLNIQTNPIARTKSVMMQKVYPDGATEKIEDIVICEHLLRVFVNERQVAQLVCTPTDLVELILGRLLTEGIITEATDIENLFLCESGNEAKVFLDRKIALDLQKSDFQTLQGKAEATCCTGNKVFLQNAVGEPLQNLTKKYGRIEWKSQWIFGLAKVFAEDSRLHQETKGTHSCYLSVDGEYVFHSEDIGRHNAMDKCIGYAVKNEIDRKRCILFTTGRVPTDMVQKAIAAGVPILVSKAVPTDAAITMAEEYGLTLICKAWPDSYVVCK